MRSLVCAAGLAIASMAPASAVATESPARVPRIGILMLEPRSPGDLAETVTRALNALGYRDGTAAFDVRSAAWSHARLRELASELAASKVDVIVALTNVPGFAAKEATKTVPIVVLGTHAAVETGLVDSLARPGGNITGVENLAPELDSKRLQLLREIAPRVKRLGVGDWLLPSAVNAERMVVKLRPLLDNAAVAERCTELAALTRAGNGIARSIELIEGVFSESRDAHAEAAGTTPRDR